MADRVATITALNGELKGKHFPIESDITTIGRDPECGLVIDQPSVSRAHARIERIGSQYRIMDLGSRNGITINEKRMPEAALENGVIFGIGDLRFRFEAPRPEPRFVAQPRSEPVEAEQYTSAAPVEPGAYEAGEPEPVRRGILAAALAITGIVVLIGAAVMLLARGSDPIPDILRMDPVKVMVNENRLIPVRGYVRSGGGLMAVRPTVLTESIRAVDPTVADASKFEDNYLLIRGRAGGETDILMETPRGNMVAVRVIVRGRVPDALEQYRILPLGDRERREMAARYVETGDRLLAARPYRALENYWIAEALMEPVSPKGTFYVQLEQKIVDARTTAQERYDEFSAGVRRAYAANDIDAALALLQSIKELIPDTNDPRHQKAELHIREVVIDMDRRRR